MKRRYLFALTQLHNVAFGATRPPAQSELILDRYVEVTGGRSRPTDKRHKRWKQHPGVQGRRLKGAITRYSAEPGPGVHRSLSWKASARLKGINKARWEKSAIMGLYKSGAERIQPCAKDL